MNPAFPRVILVLASLVAATAIAAAQTADPFPAADPPPAWAFAMDPPATAHMTHDATDTAPHHIAGSTVALTRAQTQDLFDVPDWRPDRHPPAPGIVMHGRRPGAYACGFCHLPNGTGIPENASLAGLPEGYILKQIVGYRSGARGTARPEMVSHIGMTGIAKAITDDEAKAAAHYYASLKPRTWIKVIETVTVPRTIVKAYTLVRDPAGGTEPIGDRIIEIPADEARSELRDDASGYLAYVPPGSIARGRALAATGGGGRTLACAACHGSALRGQGDVPSIAGRSPSNLVRQLYDIQYGKRTGNAVAPMVPVVAGLTAGDRVALVAYLTSLKP